jgi:hypothetical protein
MGLNRRLFALLGAALFISAPAHAEDKFIVMASTTSTEQSGLFKHLLPLFKRATGIDVRVVAVGTGQALDAGRRGDADVLFVHDQAAENKFVADGFALKRSNVMYTRSLIPGHDGTWRFFILSLAAAAFVFFSCHHRRDDSSLPFASMTFPHNGVASASIAQPPDAKFGNEDEKV